jgi:hypothetical protein
MIEVVGMHADGSVKSEEMRDCTLHQVRYRTGWIGTGE